MRSSPRPEPPTVAVLLAPRVPGADAVLREVLAGLEEEGVPALVETAGAEGGGADPGPGSVALAVRAAGRSALEVGVGLGADGLCLTHRALPPGSPLQHVPDPPPPGRARLLGHDAARLVTGVPLTTPRS